MEGRNTGGAISERVDIPELRRLLEATSPLPWYIDKRRRPDERYTWLYDAVGLLIGGTSGVANADLIVGAVNALPVLLEEMERLRGMQGNGEVAQVSSINLQVWRNELPDQ